MKIIVIGDVHGRDDWKEPAYKEDYDYIVFVGDYFDSFTYSALEQINNFEEIIELKKKYPDKVILLIGNHDMHYFPEIGYNSTTGYQAGVATDISYRINNNREHLQMAFAIENLLFTHAGVSEVWMKRIVDNESAMDEVPSTNKDIAEWINDVWKYKPRYFNFTGEEESGNNKTQTPVWIRPQSLMSASKNICKQGIVQIVGHTAKRKLESKANEMYWFVDTMGTSNEYLVWENGQFSINTYLPDEFLK